MKITSPTGVFDIIPKDTKEQWRSVYLWQYVENIVRRTARDFGYHEIRTPIFERAELFQRGVGETSDIVSKEMYLFEDKGERLMSLRPEGTAPVMRAFIENHMQEQGSIHKLFYIAPMFRYDRPQAGRYRQHHQFGVEVIAPATPEQDAEIIAFLWTVYQRIGIRDFKVHLNSLGDIECRKAYRAALQEYLRPHQEKLSEDSKRRLEMNPLRILDSKDPKDQEVVAQAPSILDFLNEQSRDYFQSLRALLESLHISYTVDPHLVRGLDYYNQTVFEIITNSLGAQNSLGGGGRYDGLLKLFGGPDLPSIGFGAGIERLIQVMLKQEVSIPAPTIPKLYLIPIGETANAYLFKLTHELRQEGISVCMDFSHRKVAKALQHANQIGAPYVAVVGENELASKEVELKHMTTGKVQKIPIKSLAKVLRIEEHAKEYAMILDELDKPFENAQEAQFFYNQVKEAVLETEKATKALQEKVRDIKNWLATEE